uniref:Odorant receptor n=1 Tax=Adelphocoris lineolatus TaxID=236346 RepID=A0A1B3Z575_ADELI|nr:olfactory receptor 8 [Adelphocoris lineolatus]APZ81451.1 olfactory receptor 29 [Adelphocoris lineolatus]
MDSDQFRYVREVYRESLGLTGMDVFLDEKPPDHRVIRWHVLRKFFLLFVFVYYPIFISTQIWGIAAGDSNTLKQISFDISLLGHNIQNFIKMGIWITRIQTVRSLCLDFPKFHINNYRPNLASWILEKESKDARNFTGRCYWISYVNLLFWVVLPTSTAGVIYLAYLAGYKEERDTYIPRYSPVRFPVDMTLRSSRLLVAGIEMFQFYFGFLLFQPIDMFFTAIIQMAHAQIRVLNSALFSLDGELQEYWGIQVPEGDPKQPMEVRLIIEDHQKIVKYGQRLREFLNPILGFESFNCITVICNMTIVAASEFSAEGEFLDLALPAFSSILVVFTSLTCFYTFTKMTAVLKDAEESIFHALYASNWYEKDVNYRKSIILMQKLTHTPRRIKMCGIGDMGRSTFIDGSRMVYTYYNFMQRFK